MGEILRRNERGSGWQRNRCLGLAAALAGEEEFFEEEPGEEGGVVADDAVLFEEIVGDDANAELKEFFAIEADGSGVLGAIAAGDVGRNRFGVGDDDIDGATGNVMLDGAEMIAEGVAGGLTGLSHQISDVDARGFRMDDSAGNFRDQQIGNDAGVERTGAHEDEVGVFDGFDGGGERAHAAGIEREFSNGEFAAGDARFAMDAGAVGKRGDEVNVGKGGREDAAANGENFAGDTNGFGEIAGDMGESREEEVAEIVAGKATTGVETILEELSEQGFILGECDHAVSNVAGREHAVFAAKAAGTAAVIGDGDDGGEIEDGALSGRLVIAATNDVLLEAAEEGGEAGAASESDHPDALDWILVGARTFHEQLKRFITSRRWRAHLVESRTTRCGAPGDAGSTSIG